MKNTLAMFREVIQISINLITLNFGSSLANGVTDGVLKKT